MKEVIITRLSIYDFQDYLKAIDPKFRVERDGDWAHIFYGEKEVEIFPLAELDTQKVKECAYIAWLNRNATISEIYKIALEKGYNRRRSHRRNIDDFWWYLRKEGHKFVVRKPHSVYIRRS